MSTAAGNTAAKAAANAAGNAAGHFMGRLAALLGACALALAPAAQADEPGETESQMLYQQALQSIAEGRKNDASATLNEVVTKEPLHAGAWLDLALIQCALGHADEAERLFAAIEVRFNPPQGIVELISEARAGGCSNWQRQSHATLSIGRGLDQNVNQGSYGNSYGVTQAGVQVELPQPVDFQPKHDQYSWLSADYLRDLTPNGSSGYLQLQSRRYDRLGQYNSTALYVGADTPWRFGHWTVRGSASLGLITLGAQLYQRQTQLQVKVGPPLPLPGSVQFHLTAGMSRADYLTLSNFNANTLELRGQFTYHRDADLAAISLGGLDDRALAARPGGDRRGWLATLQWKHQLPFQLMGELNYSQQRWNGSAAYAPGFIDDVRKQRTTVLRAALSYPLSPSQSLLIEGRQVRNQESISIFQYNDRQLQLSWQWQTP